MRAQIPVQTILVLKGLCGLQHARLANNFGDERLVRAASPQRSGATLVVKALCKLLAQKNRCGLPARTAGSSFGAQRLVRATSPLRSDATLALKGQSRVPARTAWQQFWCPHRSSPALVFKGWCRLHRQQLWCSQAYQPALLGNNFWKQPWCSKARACCQPALGVGADRHHADVALLAVFVRT